MRLRREIRRLHKLAITDTGKAGRKAITELAAYALLFEETCVAQARVARKRGKRGR